MSRTLVLEHPKNSPEFFRISNFPEFEKEYLSKPGFKLIQKENFYMIELIDLGFDVRAYFSNPPLDVQLHIK